MTLSVVRRPPRLGFLFGLWRTAARHNTTHTTERPIVQLSDGANERFLKLLRKKQLTEDGCIVIQIQNKGCAGLTYDIRFKKWDDIKDDPRFVPVVSAKPDHTKVVVERSSLGNLIGSEIDWHDGEISSQFVFKNPNAVENCPCGRSFGV